MKIIESFKAHSEWITTISVSKNDLSTFASGSRDCIILIWEITNIENSFAIIKKRLIGHSNYISDLIFSSDGKFCISSSWDHTIRIWDLNSMKTIRKFTGHKNDILSIAFSNDNRIIASGSRDKTIKIWNTMGECKITLIEKKNNYWVSCVKILPGKESLILSCYWDGTIKIWKVSKNEIKSKLNGHKGFINSATVSPDGSLCASGGKDGMVILWDLHEEKHLYSLEAGDMINALCFSPNRYWLCASTIIGIKIWDLETKELIQDIRFDLKNQQNLKKSLPCMSMAWTIDGLFFLTGHMDGILRVWSNLEN
jgi:guanine nucleotide-binding protein subunit beta-2-like 1 protein